MLYMPAPRNVDSTTPRHTLSLHDALPIFLKEFACLRVGGQCVISGSGGFSSARGRGGGRVAMPRPSATRRARSEEHTSELQSREKLVCRLLLEKHNIQTSKSLCSQ